MNYLYSNLMNKVRMATGHYKNSVPYLSTEPYLNNILIQSICDAVGFYRQYWGFNFFEILAELASAQTQMVDSLIVHSLKFKHQGQYEAACMVLAYADTLGCHTQYSRLLSADLLRKLRKFTEARKLCDELRRDFPDFDDVESCRAMCDVDELLNCPYDYYYLLHCAHMIVKPARYIEIGVALGKSLALTRAGTFAIGIDPSAANCDGLFFHSPEVEPLLFAMTSDCFFDALDVHSLLGYQSFDMAFIDGDHTFEQALKDFIQLERLAGPSSVVFIHDCLPVNPVVAEKQRKTMFWCGDVWKVLPCLKKIRPDLNIITFPATPAGLAMVTGLNPASRVLEQQFDTIVSSFSDIQLPESYSERCLLLNVADKDAVELLEEHLAPLVCMNQGCLAGSHEYP